MTQRELVTINPRRATSESTAIDATGDDDAFTEISERVTGEIPVERILEEAQAAGNAEPVAPAAAPAVATAAVPAPSPPPPPPPPAAPTTVVAPTPTVLPPPVNGARTRPPPSRVAVSTSDVIDEPRRMTPYLISAAAAVAAIVILWLAMRNDDDGHRAAQATEPPVGARPDARRGEPATVTDAAGGEPQPVDAAQAEAAIDAPTARPVDASQAKPDKRAQAKELAKEAAELVEDGQLERGLAVADKSLALSKNATAYMAKADALRRMNRTDEAIAAVDQAIARRGGRRAWRLKINILAAARRTDQAREVIVEYLDRFPDAPDADELRKRIE
jgi:hypothetical protein